MSDIYTNEETKLLLVKIYGNTAQGWDVNDGMINVLLEMIVELEACSEVYGLVPRPSYTVPNIKTVGKQAARTIFKSIREDDIYLTCVKKGTARYRERFEEAKYGL